VVYIFIKMKAAAGAREKELQGFSSVMRANRAIEVRGGNFSSA
jgi:hypothetical protein